jgi:cytochrome P450
LAGAPATCGSRTGQTRATRSGGWRAQEFQADRANARQHLAFGRGIHTCPGSPLARAEGRITIERLLRRTRNIRLSEAHHGPAADRRFSYQPTWMLRAMEELHIEFDPCVPV